MNNESLLIAIAIAGGISVALQGQFMGQIDRNVGTVESLLITYALGAFLAAVLFLLFKGGRILAAPQLVPWYVFSSGAFGLVIVGSIGYTVPRLGMASAFTLILLSQFTLAALIDHFGWFGSEVRSIDWKKGLGLLMVLGGAMLVTK